MRLRPFFPGNPFHQFFLDFKHRIVLSGKAQSLGHALNMRINRNGRNAERIGYDNIRRLSTYARQLDKLGMLPRNFPIVFVQQHRA